MAESGTYGSGSYGIAGYGFGAITPAALFSMALAKALATRIVQVSFQGAPIAVSKTAAGDALNPGSWAIQRLDTGDSFTVVSVDMISSTLFNLTVLEPFGPASVLHQITSSVLGLGGAFYLNQQIRFPGVVADLVATAENVSAQRGFAPVDVANPPTKLHGAGGTLIITSAGDYATVTGPELIRKLLLRRFTTRKGGFYHMPDYGLGPEEKSPATVGAMTRLKAEMERQAILEPEVASVQASIFADSSGIVMAQVQVKLRSSGQSITITVPGPQQQNVSL